MKNRLPIHWVLPVWIFFTFLFIRPVLSQELFSKTDIEEQWSFHFQATMVLQGHPSFYERYSGSNSFSSSAESAASYTSTLFAGTRLWKNGEIYVNPELLAGNGLSGTLGIAGFPNGEIYRVDNPAPRLNLSRLFLRQVFGFGGRKEYLPAAENRLAGYYDEKRMILTVGKFSLTDFFDNNLYNHEPRTQFLNWSIMFNGAWDYAADTRGYTWGVVLEVQKPVWSLRMASAMVPAEANMMDLDTNLSKAHGDNAEFEYHYFLKDHPGVMRFFGFMNYARMGGYRETILNPVYGMDIMQSRQYRMKYGFGLNLGQEIAPDLGTSFRAGWNDGATETWAFTEIDRTVSMSLSVKGTSWKRKQDTAGIAAAVNGLSNDHADYLISGGVGFIIGDGKLNYAPEEILETYYLWKVFPQFGVTADFQFVNHPAYNSDRGPVYLLASRLHYEW